MRLTLRPSYPFGARPQCFDGYYQGGGDDALRSGVPGVPRLPRQGYWQWLDQHARGAGAGWFAGSYPPLRPDPPRED